MLAALLAYLPTALAVAGDVATIVRGAQAAGSIYGAVKAEYPEVAKLIETVGAALPPTGASGEARLDAIATSLFAGGWTDEQRAQWFDRASAQGDA